ncbi:trypsin-like serine protease [Streptomyces celluloflavus]|uniref:trypsin-like serine protease n=1 Tax=Streptomyces celluloflavus TaxID=58344 RepID=UPI0036498BA5
MSGKSSRTTWATGLVATAVGAGLVATAVPAGAVAGDPVKDGTYPFMAHLDIGDGKRVCSGALVDGQWVLTAKNCFADKPGAAVAAGKPKLKTTVTVGRTDLSKPGGTVVEGTYLVPRAERDVVMVKLAKPVVGIVPVAVGAKAPAAMEALRVAGFGRTKTAWIPGTLHSSVFTAGTVSVGSLNLTPQSTGAAICRGDTGGAAFRENNGTPELVAVNSLSWQSGCLGETEKRTGALNARVDDIAGWVQQTRLAAIVPDVTSVMTVGDFNGDGRTDIAAVTKDGNLHAFYGRADGTFEYGRPLWKLDGSWKGTTKIIGGDFNGDGHTDIAAVWSNGSLRLYAADANRNLTANKPMWVDEKTNWNDMLHLARFKTDASGRDGLLTVWGGGPKGALYAYDTGPSGTLNGTKRNMWRDDTWQHMTKIATGDFNGDGRDDIVAVTNVGGLSRYTRYDSTAGGGLSDGVPMWHDNGWGGTQILLAGDFDGDGNTDIGSLWSNQQRFNFYKGDGKGNLAEGTHAWPRI